MAEKKRPPFRPVGFRPPDRTTRLKPVVYSLPDDSSAPLGMRSLALENGALRLAFPEAWTVVEKEHAVKLHDRPYPDDSIVLEVSVLKFPPPGARRIPTLAETILASQERRGKALTASDLTVERHPGVELVWYEYEEPDAESPEGRLVTWRSIQCHASPVRPSEPYHLGILTFGFWSDWRSQAEAIWASIAPTLSLRERKS